MNSWLLLPNKFVLTSIQEQNDQGPRKFLTMCWSMLWHHTTSQEVLRSKFQIFIATLSTDVRIFIKERIADLPVTNKWPLNLSVPKTLFARSHSHTAFGYQAMAIPDTGCPQETMSDDVDNSMDKGADIVLEFHWSHSGSGPRWIPTGGT